MRILYDIFKKTIEKR